MTRSNESSGSTGDPTWDQLAQERDDKEREAAKRELARKRSVEAVASILATGARLQEAPDDAGEMARRLVDFLRAVGSDPRFLVYEEFPSIERGEAPPPLGKRAAQALLDIAIQEQDPETIAKHLERARAALGPAEGSTLDPRDTAQGMLEALRDLPKLHYVASQARANRAFLEAWPTTRQGADVAEAAERAAESPPENSHEELPSPSRWAGSRSGGVPLRGWRRILGALNLANTKSQRERIKTLNMMTLGPIVGVGRISEVDKGELLAWIADTRGRADALAEHRRKESEATGELDERGGIHAADVGFSFRATPNARTRERRPRTK